MMFMKNFKADASYKSLGTSVSMYSKSLHLTEGVCWTVFLQRRSNQSFVALPHL
jgi:hypothetical protein